MASTNSSWVIATGYLGSHSNVSQSNPAWSYPRWEPCDTDKRITPELTPLEWHCPLCITFWCVPLLLFPGDAVRGSHQNLVFITPFPYLKLKKSSWLIYIGEALKLILFSLVPRATCYFFPKVSVSFGYKLKTDFKIGFLIWLKCFQSLIYCHTKRPCHIMLLKTLKIFQKHTNILPH